MDIPIYDPRDDYDYMPVRKPKPQAPESKERDRHIDGDSPKQTGRDDRSPIQGRLESLKQRAADRRVPHRFNTLHLNKLKAVLEQLLAVHAAVSNATV